MGQAVKQLIASPFFLSLRAEVFDRGIGVPLYPFDAVPRIRIDLISPLLHLTYSP